MMTNYLFESNRLGFKVVTQSHLSDIAMMNSDSEVMTYFPSTMTFKESTDFVNKIIQHHEVFGYSLYAVHLKNNDQFIGLIGLLNIDFESEMMGEVEIGWRLLKEYWHEGYATEGAKAVIDYGFEVLGIGVIYSFTATINTPSEQVMKSIGMHYLNKFNHPKIKVDSSLKEHVLYRITKKKECSIKRLTNLNQDDLQKLISIWYQTNKEAHDFISEHYWEENIPFLRQELPKSCVFICLINQEIVGFIGLVETYIAGIFVKSEYQKMGIGTSLLNEVKEIKSELSLSVYQKNQQAFQFYLAQGFSVIQEKLDDENQEIEFIMKWQR